MKSRIMSVALAVVALAGAAAGCGGGSGPKVEKKISVGQDPSDVVAAYGAVWVVNDDAVGRIDPKKNALALSKFIFAGQGAGSIAAGSNLLWVAANISNEVDVIDPSTNKVVKRIRTAASELTYGDGAVWVTQPGGATIQRIDPVKQQLVGPKVPVGHQPAGLAAGNGAVWVTNQADSTVTRVDSKTNKVVATIKVGANPTDVAIGEGGVWVTNANNATVSRIDPATYKVAATIKMKGRTP